MPRRWCGWASLRPCRVHPRSPMEQRYGAAPPPPPLFPNGRAQAGGTRPRAKGPRGMLIHVQRRRVGGVGGGGTVSAGSTMYIGNRVSADIRAVMVGGDGQRGGGMCAAHSRDSISVMYRISDNDSMLSGCWLATMDGGGGGHGSTSSSWSGHLGQGRADNARTGTGDVDGVGALGCGAVGEATDGTTERRDGGATFARL